jgi:RNA polymerase sigma-70 factor, ECF subfamily
MIRSDQEIWESITNNDKKSFESLFRRYYDSLCLYSTGIVRNEEAAEEIVNEVFLRIWMNRSHIQITYGIKPYLFRSIFNACSDYLGKNRTMKQYSFVEIDDRIREIAGTNEETIFNHLQGEEVEKDVWEAINQLPNQCREVFCLSRFELLTYNEISEKLNISVNTVKTQICRGLDNLRGQLGKYL